MQMTKPALTRVQILLSELPVIAAWAALATGLAALLGDATGIAVARSLAAVLVISPSNAAGFVCAGVLLLVARRRQPVADALYWLLAAAVVALGIVELVSGRIASGIVAGTDIGLSMFGIALLLNRLPAAWGRIAARSLALLLAVISLTAILGYAYGAPELYREIAGGSAIPWIVAIVFTLMSLAVVWLRPDIGFPALLTEDSILGAHVRSLLPMVVGAPLLVGAAVAAGYGTWYDGEMAVVLTSVGSILASTVVGVLSSINLRHAESALYIKDRALAATSNGVVITDHRAHDEPIVYVNNAFTAITGWTPEDAIGQNCRFLNEGLDNDPDVMRAIRGALAGDREHVVEFQNRRRDGSRFWNRLSLAPIRGARGRASHYVGVIHDFTEKVEREARLEEALAALEAANEARETFVRLISHELRTPLNAALTWLRLMEVDDSEDTRDTGLATVAQSIESQSRLIDDLVDATRFASVGVKLETERVELAALVEQTVEELRPAAEPDRPLLFECEDSDAEAHVDPLRIQQIVRNLLSNAIKFTPAGGRINVGLETTDGGFALTVSDSGRGLSAEEQEKIFDLFWRADPHAPGLGVGLSIVAALVDAHGGTISVSSDGEGRGTTFRVFLPFDGTTDARAKLGEEANVDS